MNGRGIASVPALAGFLLTLAVSLPVRDASAQSLLGFRALGVPVAAGGGRTVAVGNLGIGLAGVELSATDPTAAAHLLFPTASVSMQPAWGEFELDDDRDGTTQTTRFPLIGVAYPVLSARGAVTFSLAGHMEQRWTGEHAKTTPLGETEVAVRDAFESDGGTSVMRLGWAQRFGERVAVGIAAGAYLGNLDQRYDRSLDSLALEGEVETFARTNSWQYDGTSFTAGFSASPHSLIHVAGAVEWSGDLKAKPRGETEGEAKRYGIPARFSAGATGSLTRRLHLNTSLVFQDWSDAAGFDPGVTSRGKLSFGAGVEWQAIEGEVRSLPLRFGFRRLALPFRFEVDDPVEMVWSAGLGLNLQAIEGNRFGWIDVGVERSTRSSGPLSERFWRATVSVGISRF